jgi:predicted small secreted protein
VRTEARFFLTLAVLLAAAPLLSACNTVRGMGEDVSAAGRGIAHTAQKVGGS